MSLDKNQCTKQCGDNEKAVEGRCVCKESAVPDAHGSSCIVRSMCGRILLSDEGAETCTGLETCDKGLFLDEDWKHCISSCGSKLLVYNKTRDETQCASTCPDTFPVEQGGFCLTCGETTDMEHPFWNGKECVACPEELPNLNRTSGMCALACPADKPYWNYFECLDCRTAYPLGDRPFWEPVERRCVTSCPFGSSANNNDICQPCADLDEDAPSFWDSESQTCVSECKRNAQSGYCLPCDAGEDL